MRGAWLILLLLTCAAPAALPAGTRYVMSHFKGDGGGGDERLYISVSPDALNWTALNGGNPVYQPVGWVPFGNVVRDPSIIYANGFYWVAHTSGTYGHHASFALLKSADLLAWTLVGEISTLTAGATDPLTWSPTFFRDGDGMVHVYVAIRPDGGGTYSPVPGMRVHELHPVSADWTQWSAPVLVDLPSTNTNELWVWKEGTVYHGIFVDFTRGGSPYVHVTSSAPVTGWSNPQVLGLNGQEGGFVLKRPESGYRVYTEAGNAGGGTYLYSDWTAGFSAATAQTLVQSSVPMRNGKAIAAPNGMTYADWSAAKFGSVQAAEGDADHDGRANVVEFATGGDPGHSDAEPVLAPMSGGLVRYRRAAGAEASLGVEISTDLVSWYGGGAYTQEQSTTLRTDGVEEIVAAPLISGTRVFYRLTASISTAGPVTGAFSALATSDVSGAPPGREAVSARLRWLAPPANLRSPRRGGQGGAARSNDACRLKELGGARPKPQGQFHWFDQLFFPRGEGLQFDQWPFVAE